MADKTGAFESGDNIDDHDSPSSTDDAGEPSTAVESKPPPQTPSEECDQWMIDSSPGCFSNTSSAFADASESSAQSSENTSAVILLEVAGKNRHATEADAPRPLSDTRRPETLGDRIPSGLQLPSRSFPDHESLARTLRKRSRIPTDKLEDTKRDANSSSESDSSTESDSVQKDSSVRKIKQTQNASTSASLNISREGDSSRLDPLNLNPMQSFLTPPSLSEGVRLSKSSPGKRLKITQLDRPKSTSPGTSYSELSRSSSVDNVHRNVPDLEVKSPESDACSEIQPSLSPEISGSPRLAEPVSLSSSLASPSSGHGSSTTTRSLSSETLTSAPCDLNALFPVLNFATFSNPSQHKNWQHAPSAHLHQAGNPRILNPQVQHSCHLPRRRICPERSLNLNFRRLNRDPKGTRIRPLQETNSTTQVSKHQNTDKTDKLDVSIEEFRTSESFLQIVEDKIKDYFRSALMEPPKLFSNVSAPSKTLLNTPKPFDAPLDTPGTSEALLNAPKPSEAPIEAPGPSEAPLDIPGPSEALLDAPKSSEAPIEAPGPSEAPLDAPGPSEALLDAPKPSEAPIEAQIEAPEPSEAPLDAPGPSEALLDAPKPSEAPGPSEAPLDAPGPSEALLDAPESSEAQLNAPGPFESSTDFPRRLNSSLIKTDDIMKHAFRSVVVETPKLPFNISPTSEAPLNAPESSEAQLNAMESSEVPLKASGSSEAQINVPETFETRADFMVPQAPLVVPGTSQILFDFAPVDDFHTQSFRFQSNTATPQRHHISDIDDLLNCLISNYLRLSEQTLLLSPSISNREEGASVGPGEAATSSYQPLSSTLSIEQPSSSSDFPQSFPFPERVAGVETNFPFRTSSDCLEEAKTMLHEICRDILRHMGDNRWLEFNRPLRRTSSPAASDNFALKLNMSSELDKLFERLPLISGLTRFDMIGKEDHAVSKREIVLWISLNLFISMISSTFSREFVLDTYGILSDLSDDFASFKTNTLAELDSADQYFRQRMPLLLDQISSYFARLLLALQNLLQYFPESVESI